jgi:hypothetical protein
LCYRHRRLVRIRYQHLHGLLRWIFGEMITAAVAAVVRGGGRTRSRPVTQKQTAGVRAPERAPRFGGEAGAAKPCP